MINTTWEQFQIYLYSERKLDRSNNASYYSMFNSITDFFKDKEFDLENTNKYFEHLQKRGLSNSTLNNNLKTLKHVAKYLKQTFLHDYSYFKKIYREQKILTPNEVEKIINTNLISGDKYKNREAEINNRYTIAIYLLSVTGMRIGELCSLKWTDLNNDYITIRAEIAKSDKERYIPITEETYNKLINLSKINEYIFSGFIYKKGKLDQKTINKIIKLRAIKAGIKDWKDIHAHSFRHYFANNKLKNNHHIDRVSKILGHSDPGITAKYYGHYNIEMLRSVVETEQQQLKEVKQVANSIDESRLEKLEAKLDHIVNYLEKLKNSIDLRHYKKERSKYFYIPRVPN